jgi:peptidoglycan/xylan/chitin deacetylase (PgdA/CDA1 family)
MSGPHLPPYRHWPVTDRPTLEFPGGKRLACYLAVNIEHFRTGEPAASRTAVTAGLPVDPLNHAWRDYGTRVGFWRMLEAIDGFGLPVSVLLNGEAAGRYPEIVDAGVQRGWAFLAHGETNSRMWTGLDEQEERAALTTLRETLLAATGTAPRGWLGPALTETESTLRLLAELGFSYSLDWIADDQPFPLIAGTSPFVSVPYSIEINDIPAFVDQALTPRQFTEVAIDHFEVLHEESHRRPGAVYALSLHPFLVGQPFRHRHLLDILEAISGHEDVWYANSDEIADWYITNHLSAAEAAIDQYERKWKR